MNYTYTGKIYKNCDPSAAQKGALSAAQSMQEILSNSYATVFGAGSSIFNSLKTGYDKIINTVHGLSPEEKAARNSEILNNASAASKKVQQTIGERAAVSGVVPGVESGVVQATRAAADTAILTQASAAQEEVTAEDYAIGRKERDAAMAAEGKLTGEAFSPATGFAGAEEGAIGEESSQANANAAASTSWMGLVGGLADAAVGGLTASACVDPATEILMADGSYKAAGELQPWDEVNGIFGKEIVKYTFVSIQPCVRVTTDNGTKIVVSGSHTFALQGGGYVKANDCLGRVLEYKQGYTSVETVEAYGDRNVVFIALTDRHMYVSNGIWSLE